MQTHKGALISVSLKKFRPKNARKSIILTSAQIEDEEGIRRKFSLGTLGPDTLMNLIFAPDVEIMQKSEGNSSESNKLNFLFQ